MTITLAEPFAPLSILEKGRMTCDIADCTTEFGHPVVVDHDVLTPRQQLRKAAALCGWRETVAGLVVCPDCVAGPVGIVIAGWAQRWAPPEGIELQVGPPVMNGDTQQTLTIPAVVEPVSAGRHPYDSPKGNAA